MKSQDKGIKRILKAFTYSFDGFKATFKSEEAFRQDCLFCFVFFIVLLFLNLNHVDFILCFLSLVFILFSELVNTAVESLVDRISDDYHELSKKAKDIGSLLVLISFIVFFVVWGVILYSNFLK